MPSGIISAGMLAFSRVPRPRTVSTWSTSLNLSSSSACWDWGKSSVIIMEKAPFPNSSSIAC